MGKYYCYLLARSTRTYIGITNDLEKRILKHRGLLKGGAKSTRAISNIKGVHWNYHTIVEGFENKGQVMSFEWYWKHIRIGNEDKKKWVGTRAGINNKMNRLLELLLEEQWSEIKITVHP